MRFTTKQSLWVIGRDQIRRLCETSMPFNSHCSLKEYRATQIGKRSHISYLGIAVTGYLEGATSVGKNWLWLLVSAHPGGEDMAGSSAHPGGEDMAGSSAHPGGEGMAGSSLSSPWWGRPGRQLSSRGWEPQRMFTSWQSRHQKEHGHSHRRALTCRSIP